MKTPRVLVALLSVIAAGVVVIAAALVFGVVDRDHTEAWRDARDQTSQDAESFCKVLGIADGTNEAEPGCIEEHSDRMLEEWESENPDDVWK